MRKGFFAYSWDLLDEGIEAALANMVERCGCDAIALTSSYHSARVIRPRMPGPKVYTRPGPGVSFSPTPAYYADGAPLPIVDQEVARADVLVKSRAWCREHGVDYGLWTVGLHNSTLGTNDPTLCSRNCFGDTYTYNLCPSKPRVRAYLRGLIRDVCAQVHPDRILLETAGYLGLLHWVHHEKVGLPMSEAEEMLLFLCFCPDCLERARQMGLDGEAARAQAARLAEALSANERGALPPNIAIADMPALLVEFPELYDYVRMRAEITGTLVGQVRELANAEGAKLEVMPSAFGIPVARAWREGMTLRRLAQASDGLIPLGYYPDPSQVRAELRWTKMLGGDKPMSVGLTACHPIAASAGGLAANVAACAAEGAAGVYYYNYGMLNEERLDWVAQANRQVSG